MKKLILTLLLITACLGSGYAQQKPSSPRNTKPAPAMKAAPKTDPAAVKAPAQPVTYFDGTFEKLKAEILEKKKPAMIFLYAGNHWRSKDFEVNMLADTALTTLIDTGFIAYKVNTYDNYDIPLELGIKDSPSIIVLGADLNEAARMEGMRYPDGLLELLLKVLK